MKYINNFTNFVLNEMAILHPKDTNLDGVFIWIGKKEPKHGHRIKISNKNDRFDPNDCFSLSIPKYEIVAGEIGKNIKRKFNDVVNFIKKYENDIIKFSNLNMDASDLILKIKNNNNNNNNNNIVHMNELHSFKMFNDCSKISDTDLYNLTAYRCDINNKSDIYIWMGKPDGYSKQHRVKIINKLNNWDPETSVFTILIPDLIIVGNINSQIFDTDRLDDVLSYLKLNMDTIINYSNDKLSPGELIDSLKPYKK